MGGRTGRPTWPGRTHGAGPAPGMPAPAARARRPPPHPPGGGRPRRDPRAPPRRGPGDAHGGGGRELERGRAALGGGPGTDRAFPGGGGWIGDGGMVTGILDSGRGRAPWSLLDGDEVSLTADPRTEFYRPTRRGRIRE